MPTFDIVSRADLTEVENAVQGVLREIKQRYDFKDSKARIDRDGDVLTLLADDDMRLRQMHELLQTYLVRRKVDPAALEYKDPQNASGGALRQTAVVRQGIPADAAKRITKAIKDSKLKVQPPSKARSSASAARSATTSSRPSRWSRTSTSTARCNTSTCATSAGAPQTSPPLGGFCVTLAPATWAVDNRRQKSFPVGEGSGG